MTTERNSPPLPEKYPNSDWSSTSSRKNSHDATSFTAKAVLGSDEPPTPLLPSPNLMLGDVQISGLASPSGEAHRAG